MLDVRYLLAEQFFVKTGSPFSMRRAAFSGNEWSVCWLIDVSHWRLSETNRCASIEIPASCS
jgi:hypothetical protein